MGAHPILPIMHVLAAICRPTGRPNSNEMQALLHEGKRMQTTSVLLPDILPGCTMSMMTQSLATVCLKNLRGRCADFKEGLCFLSFVKEDHAVMLHCEHSKSDLNTEYTGLRGDTTQCGRNLLRNNDKGLARQVGRVCVGWREQKVIRQGRVARRVPPRANDTRPPGWQALGAQRPAPWRLPAVHEAAQLLLWRETQIGKHLGRSEHASTQPALHTDNSRYPTCECHW